jgi:hypothetical protein
MTTPLFALVTAGIFLVWYRTEGAGLDAPDHRLLVRLHRHAPARGFVRRQLQQADERRAETSARNGEHDRRRHLRRPRCLAHTITKRDIQTPGERAEEPTPATISPTHTSDQRSSPQPTD